VRVGGPYISSAHRSGGLPLYVGLSRLDAGKLRRILFASRPPVCAAAALQDSAKSCFGLWRLQARILGYFSHVDGDRLS